MSTDDLAAIVKRVEDLRRQLNEALDERDELIRELLTTHTPAEVAEIAELDRQQVYYISKGRRR